MQKTAVLSYQFLEKWAKDASIENIIIGTGTLARDLRRKLRLLNLKVPFMVGLQGGQTGEIRHYSAIEKLEEPKRYRFIICCQENERELLFSALIPVYRLLGNATWNHPQVIRFHADHTIVAHAGGSITDAGRGSIFLREGRPYIAYGDESRQDALRIHVLGSCFAGAVMRYTAKTYPEHLFEMLQSAGLACVVYAWGQILSSFSDSMLQLIRDVSQHRMDLVIQFGGTTELNPLYLPVKNMLSVRMGGPDWHPLYMQLRDTYKGAVSNGVDHTRSLLEIRVAQHRAIAALSRQYGFVFWDIIAPTSEIIMEAQARQFRGLSPAFYARKRQQKDELVAALHGANIKDYSDAFAGVDDIFSMYVDARHFSDEAFELLAARSAKEILADFGAGSCP